MVARQYDASHGQEEILHVCDLLEEQLMQRVPEAETSDICILRILAGVAIDEAYALTIAGLNVEKLALRCHHVLAQTVHHLPGHLVITTVGHIVVAHATYLDRRELQIIVEVIHYQAAVAVVLSRTACVGSAGIHDGAAYGIARTVTRMPYRHQVLFILLTHRYT